MQFDKDSYSAFVENDVFELSILSVIGDREEQQDNSGYVLNDTDGIVVVCDGMGGYAGGKLASMSSVEALLKIYLNIRETTEISEMLVNAAEDIDQKIAALADEAGNDLGAGTTIVSVVIRNNELYWLSVGDSRIYLFRDGELLRATKDHNYLTLLEAALATGDISPEEYEQKKERGEGLVSYLGLSGLPFIESNQEAFELKQNDKILLMSDGLYKLLPDEEIQRLLINFSDTAETLRAFEYRAQRSANQKNINRDNMTLALIRIK